MKNQKVCIIDDDMICTLTTKKILAHSGYSDEIVSFVNGRDAFNFICENITDIEKLPDVIFLDIEMPFMNGFQFMAEYEKIKAAIGKEICIYMVSSSTAVEDIEKALSFSSVQDYFVKPFAASKLIVALTLVAA